MIDVDIETRPAKAMGAALIGDWRRLQRARPGQGSPFFSPEFTGAVARCRPDVRISLVRSGGELLAVLPHHRRAGGRGVPVGGQISDYQGFIGGHLPPDQLARVLGDSGLSCYDFNHALADDPVFASNAYWRSASPRIDLGRGFDAWLADRNAATSALKTTARKRRKIERELGDLRFVPDDDDPRAWVTFMEWKRAALGHRGARLILDTPWVAHVADQIRGIRTPSFAGLFSTLYAGERLIAAHFGMRSDRVWHWWFPAYDPALSPYSPGMVQLLFCVEHAAALGLGELDLGRGTQRYKTEFANASRSLCEGSLEHAARPLGAVRRARKLVQRRLGGERPGSAADFGRRAGNRLLRAGII